MQTWQPHTLETCKRYLPHVQMSAIFSEESAFAIPEASQLFNEAASHLTVRARYKQAEIFCLELGKFVDEFNGSSSRIVRTLNN